MSEHHDIPGARPRRADPLQPDRPGSGNSAADEADPARGVEGEAGMHRGADERPDAALKNVREGYGGPTKDDNTDDPSMVPNRPASDAQ